MSTAVEHVSTATFTQRVADFLRARPSTWIPATTFEHVGGRQAWRTRISDARALLPGQIVNRCRRITREDGSHFTLSEYMYVPPPDAAPEGRLF